MSGCPVLVAVFLLRQGGDVAVAVAVAVALLLSFALLLSLLLGGAALQRCDKEPEEERL